jgi:hypothetical protein
MVPYSSNTTNENIQIYEQTEKTEAYSGLFVISVDELGKWHWKRCNDQSGERISISNDNVRFVGENNGHSLIRGGEWIKQKNVQYQYAVEYFLLALLQE